MDLRRVTDIDFRSLVDRPFHPSPVAWEDEVLYFLLLDRFSDGRELDYRDNDGHRVSRGTTPLLGPDDRGNAVTTDADAARWRAAGAKWCGGTLNGLRTKLGYLKRLGVTAVWISPVLKQVPFEDTYHGYATQNFLAVDPHFGTAEDLRATVEEAHRQGIRVILDVVFNHAGNVFAYVDGGDWTGRPFEVQGFRDKTGEATIPFGETDDLEGAVWPAELQEPGVFTCKGRIVNWDAYPEYVDGDFFDLKDIHLGSGEPDRYQPSDALRALTRAYQYWIAFADLDGLRVDTVKHMDRGAARFFASVIHEFAQSIGKENFCLIAEITGDRQFAFETLEQVGMDAALGLAEIQDQLEWTVKGRRDPRSYFDLFRDSFRLGKDSHTWLRNRVVTGYDDHDQVRKGEQKARFAADDLGQAMALAAIALTVTTLGIPCIYYGSEQAFAGPAASQIRFLAGLGWGSNDRYLREAMFGPAHPRAPHSEDLDTQVLERDETLPGFGPFGTFDTHAFDPSSPAYRRIAALCATRARHAVLRAGRQYQRPIRVFGDFALPAAGELVAWSRILDTDEAVVIVNPNGEGARGGQVVVGGELSDVGDEFLVVVNTAEAGAAAGTFTSPHPAGSRLAVKGRRFAAEPTFLAIDPLPPAEVLVLVKIH